MVNKSTLRKAEDILLEERIFILSNKGRYEYFIVRGKTDMYDVTYDKGKQKWNCTCKNIRRQDCSHILAAKKFRTKHVR